MEICDGLSLIPPSKKPEIKWSGPWGEISPNRAPFPIQIIRSKTENPVKPPFSVRVENTLKSRFDCQNKADLHLIYWSPKALKPRLFLPFSLSHPNPGKAARTRIWGSFFPGTGLKTAVINTYREMSGLSRDYDVFWGFPYVRRQTVLFPVLPFFTRTPRIQTLFNSRISPDPTRNPLLPLHIPAVFCQPGTPPFTIQKTDSYQQWIIVPFTLSADYIIRVDDSLHTI